jgi:hypothetical protein
MVNVHGRWCQYQEDAGRTQPLIIKNSNNIDINNNNINNNKLYHSTIKPFQFHWLHRRTF